MSFNTQIMNSAWDISNTAKAFFGGSAKDFIAKSLELIYAGIDNAFTPATTAHEVKLAMVINNERNYITSLINLGGSEWKNYGKHRIYFDIDTQCELLGLRVQHDKTGKISSATLDGEEISNWRVNKIIGALDKFWYDVKTGHFGWSRYMDRGLANDLRKILEEKK